MPVEARLQICAECPHAKRVSVPLVGLEHQQCELCGCVIALKARLPIAECPLGKWPAWKTEPQPPPRQGGCGCNKS
jgi:hypothetical protein